MPNPLLRVVERDQMPEAAAARWDEDMRVRGEATFIGVAANAPELLSWYYDSFYAKVFYGGRIPVRLKELLRIKLSTEHGCGFCNRGNERKALAAGIRQEQIDALQDIDSPVFSAEERAVLRLADQIKLPNMQGTLDRALYAALREHFDDAEIFELGLTAGILTGMAKFLFVYDLVSKEENCPILAPIDVPQQGA